MSGASRNPVPALDIEIDEPRLARLAAVMAYAARPGDVVALVGDLGAGKSTFARAFIRAALGDPCAEVPSPTFSLRQDYDGPRFPVTHVDLYRIADPSEVDELGLDEHQTDRVLLVEWPERAPESLPARHTQIRLSEVSDPDLRRVTVTAIGGDDDRLSRTVELAAFLDRATLPPAAFLTFLQGDASSRRYGRITGEGRSLVLMDAPRQPDGPPIRDGRPYSRIAHLAEDVRPFVAIGDELARRGLSAARIFERDLDRGFLLVEDLGDRAFGAMLDKGEPQAPMWLAAVDVLVAMRALPVGVDLPVGDGTTYRLPRFDRAALEIETELLLDWYWPAVKGGDAPEDVRAEFRALWARDIDRMLSEPPGWFLRDYHSPNLFWLPGREGPARVGLIDYQDALAEHWAYDLVSVLQDARVDVPDALQEEGFERYCTAVAATDPTFDRHAFAETYARFGLQRNTRLAGLWVRLLRRDGKPGYLRHMPRTWSYIDRNLAHPALAPMRAFYDRHFPPDVRARTIAP